MATRGRGFLLLGENVIQTFQFNGDMYPEGHGNKFFEGIKKSNSEHHFVNFVNDFNNSIFNYSENLTYSIINDEFYDVEEFVIDFRIEYFKRFFSDWLFFKNITGTSVKFITLDDDEVIIKNGNYVRFNYGSLY